MQIPEHPEIAMALRTGYPHKCRSIRCADCIQEFFWDAVLYIHDGNLVCSECLKDRLLANYTVADLAAAFDIPGTTVSEQLEENGYGSI